WGHLAAAPETLETWVVLFEEARDEREALGAVGEELGAAPHGDAADRALVRNALGDHAHAGITPQVADLLCALDADHGQCGDVVHEPHRHRERRAVALERGEHDDLSRRQEALNAGRVEAHGSDQRGTSVARPAAPSMVNVK